MVVAMPTDKIIALNINRVFPSQYTEAIKKHGNRNQETTSRIELVGRSDNIAEIVRVIANNRNGINQDALVKSVFRVFMVL